MTRREGNSVFTGIPTKQQLTEWGYTEVAPPEPYTPTEEDIKRQRMDEIRQQLSDTDYIIIKKAEGIDISEYNERYEGDFLAWRQRLRNEYNQLEESL